MAAHPAPPLAVSESETEALRAMTRAGTTEQRLAMRARIILRAAEGAAHVDVADELGVSSSQVALAWIMAGRMTLHPIVGARRLEQLTDNLAAVDLRLPDEAVRRLDEVSAIELGFPSDFIKSMGRFVYGTVGSRVDFVNRRR